MKSKEVSSKYGFNRGKFDDYILKKYNFKVGFSGIEIPDNEVEKVAQDYKDALAAEVEQKKQLGIDVDNKRQEIREKQEKEKEELEKIVFITQERRGEIEKERIAAREQDKENLLYELKGARGRSIKVYPYKCVITTDVTLGSIITNNATDGIKTIYYKDCIGIQFKPSGLTLGYLQLETAGGTMNNEKSNFFNENTFTFESSLDDLMVEVYEYIISIFNNLKMI